MDLEVEVLNVIAELDRLNPNGSLDPKLLEKDALPTFYTASNGQQRYFTSSAIQSVRNAARLIYSASEDLKHKVKESTVVAETFKVFTDLHATGAFVDAASPQEKKSRKVEACLKALLLTQPKIFHHYIGASALDAETLNEFRLGPVCFHSRQGWLSSVASQELSAALSLALLSEKDLSHEELKEAIVKMSPDSSLVTRIVSDAYFLSRPLREWPLILEVRDVAVDYELSREKALVVAEAAMDSLALLFADPEAHRSIRLHEWPRKPSMVWTLAKVPGQGFASGSTITDSPWVRSPARTRELLDSAADFLSVAGKAMEAFLDPSTHSSPMLAQRWLIALRWFGAGCRESDDQIGLAKVATSLDTLSCGGKANGISAMLCNLTGIDQSKQVVKAPFPRSLKQLVEDIYNDGRSRILHGTYADPLKPFSLVRAHATYLARIALREALMRWEKYSGPDTEKAFCSIPAV